MSYLAFHLVFLLPPLTLLALLGLPKGLPLKGYLLMPLIALVWTTPWDNLLVYLGVWGYPEERVLLRIGYVPLEEYLFFLLQPLLTGLWTWHLWRRLPQEPAGPEGARGLGARVFLLLSILGGGLLLWEEGTYLGLILVWFGPVLALQWGFGGDLLLGMRRPYLWGILIPTLYLWAADWFAIQNGIWEISKRYTLDLSPLGLPLEEAVFFLVVNLAIVQGLLLFWHEASWARLKTYAQRFF